MLNKAVVERLVPILKKDCRRAMRMRVDGFPRPYFCSLLLRDIQWFNTWASSGSIYRKRADRTRNVYCDIRVGSYRYDQVAHGGLRDNDEERESVSQMTVPIDDKNYDGLRLALWRLTESRFRDALTDYSQKEAARILNVDPNKDFASFVKLPRQVYIDTQRPERVDQEKWAGFCKKMSEWIADLPHLSTSWIEYEAVQHSTVFVSTERSVIVQHFQLFSLTVQLSKLTSEGSYLDQELVINCSTQKELPNLRDFKAMVREKHQKLLKLLRAKKIHSFSGPVLLCPNAAGLLFHEALGHRLEGNRLLSSGEGQTFKDQIGKRILNSNISVSDNPKLKAFAGRRCVGSYHFDDEGTPARNALLVEDGILRGFLTSRAAIAEKGFVPNGHARNKKYERPISRMAVTIVSGKNALSPAQLREMLLEEINEQGKPFGMIVYETSGGETETTSYDFQAFAGNISYATLIYPDGREVVVRGVNFVGTPMQALSNVIAVGNDPQIDNGFCGAESGFIPVTTIAPSVLLKELELQAKEEQLVTQFILPRPRLERKGKKSRTHPEMGSCLFPDALKLNSGVHKPQV